MLFQQSAWMRSYLLILFFLVVFLLSATLAQGFERRKEQFTTEPAHLILPSVYNMPGLGSGWMIVALGTNVFDTQTDAYIVALRGALDGTVVGIADIHLLPKLLILNFEGINFHKASKIFYAERGMDSDPDAYMTGVADKVVGQNVSLTLTLFNRRFEAFYLQGKEDIRAIAYIDPNEVRYDLPKPLEMESTYQMQGAQIDITDDYADPHVGIRAGYRKWYSAPDTTEAPDFYVNTFQASGYIPVGPQSTWAIGVLQSDAVVTREGLTDYVLLRAREPQCFEDPVCEEQIAKNVENTRLGNKHGTSAALGGTDILRGYPEGRFAGAHTRWWGTEFRWNLTSEFSPFNYFIWKDIRTALQVAFFYDTGSVGETAGEVGEIWKDVYGAGFRIVTHAGYAFRIDYSIFDEGSNMVMIFNYPW